MTRNRRPYACEDCGVLVDRPVRSDRPKLCIDHAIARSIANTYRRAAMGESIRAVRARQREATTTEV